MFGILDEFEMFEDSDGKMIPFQLYDNISEFIHTFEESAKNKKNKNKPVDEQLDLGDDLINE
jgi:hypothetical protein